MITTHALEGGPVRGPDHACRLLLGLVPILPALAILLPGARGTRLLVGDLGDAEDLCGAARAAGASRVVAFVVAAPATPLDVPLAFDKLRGETLDILIIRGERRWSLLCTGPHCCPAKGVRWQSTARG